MSTASRNLKYALAINEALHQMMAADESVFLVGQGVKSPWYVGSTAKGLLERFGPERVIDTPVSENAITGAAVGAAIVGMRPVVIHPRMDFMLYAMDPIVNEAANWHYMFGGKSSVPVVIWGVLNRGGEQAAQHSQAFHTLFSHIPGLKVVMPSTPYDAKGLMIAAIRDPNPVIYIDDRWIHQVEGPVPAELYEVPIGKGMVHREGSEVTLVAVSYLVPHAMDAADALMQEGIDCEVIDLRTIKPFDRDLVIDSVRKTGRIAIADVGWKSYGMAAEIASVVFENCFSSLKSPPARITLPDSPAPASLHLEAAYYPGRKDIEAAIRKMFADRSTRIGRWMVEDNRK